MVAFHEPLELEYWFVNVFSGTPVIFSLISIMAITTICAMFKMPTSSFMVILVLFSGILFAFGQKSALILLALVLTPILYWIIRRVVD